MLRVLEKWGLSGCEIIERLCEDSPRPIYRVRAGNAEYLLKGIPDSKPESVIAANMRAYRHLSEKGMAPCVYPLPDGNYHILHDGYWFCLMEYIDGRQMQDTPEDEYLLGRLARRLHSLDDYDTPSALSEDKSRFYGWFADRPFKPEFDALLDALPDFSRLERCFIHSDLGPHNAMVRRSGEAVLIDLDDAGIGSRHLDLGWAFIMQFVEHTEEMVLSYRFDLAEAFVRGYYGGVPSREEYDLVWHGAVYMHISYMKTYGEGAVQPLWQILRFGLEQKETLWAILSGT